MSEQPALEAHGVHYSYPHQPALRGVSLRVRRAEAVAIVGPSGCGKSTFLSCLAGILEPDRGRVIIDGDELTGLSDAERRRIRGQRMGFVLQFGMLMPELTVLENACVPALLRGSSRTAADAEALRLLDRVGVANLKDRLPSALSGGQRQRAAIARALVGSPSIVLADEPTGALDSDNSRSALDLLLETSRECGAAVIVVTHDPSLSAALDRTIVMKDGLVVDDDQTVVIA